MLARLGGSGGGGGDLAYRIPLAWAPGKEQRYSFRAWAPYLHVWLMLMDAQLAQQAAWSCAWEVPCASWFVASPRKHQQGGIVNGVLLAPIAYIVTGLQQRSAMLDDDHCPTATTQVLAFSRRQGKTIHGTLAR